MININHIELDQVRALLKAMENGQESEASDILSDITNIAQSDLYKQVSNISKDLEETLNELNQDDQLLVQTKHDIPDAAERLQYVIETTEEASNKTLESAENALSYISNTIESLKEQAEFDHSLIENLESANNAITDVIMAQSFQDLTGQVLNRVILIISSLEQSLHALIDRSSHDLNHVPEKAESAQDIREEEMKGIGPNVTAKSKKDSVESQDDVDDLLSDLGI